MAPSSFRRHQPKGKKEKLINQCVSLCVFVWFSNQWESKEGERKGLGFVGIDFVAFRTLI
ncbi:hypothetical protein Fmac_005114 [Flemingia macrophylla]|uniref:Uncharacterized protein n=1 Tax=Flemingia macrophylla TaxID=520843 RepID=A0ABD1N701_9FABA